MDGVPNEIASLIASHLDLADAAALAATCRRLRLIAQESIKCLISRPLDTIRSMVLGDCIRIQRAYAGESLFPPETVTRVINNAAGMRTLVEVALHHISDKAALRVVRFLKALISNEASYDVQILLAVRTHHIFKRLEWALPLVEAIATHAQLSDGRRDLTTRTYSWFLLQLSMYFTDLLLLETAHKIIASAKSIELRFQTNDSDLALAVMHAPMLLIHTDLASLFHPTHSALQILRASIGNPSPVLLGPESSDSECVEIMHAARFVACMEPAMLDVLFEEGVFGDLDSKKEIDIRRDIYKFQEGMW